MFSLLLERHFTESDNKDQIKASIIIYDPFLLDITGDTAVTFISAWVT